MFGQLNQQTLRRFNVKGSYVEIGAAPADLNYEVTTAEEFWSLKQNSAILIQTFCLADYNILPR